MVTITKKILIAEDDEPLLKALEEKIKKYDYTVIKATSGSEAIEKFNKEKPDLVLLDIVMPSKSGFDVLEEIKIKQKSKVPVIILSNLSAEQDIETGKRLGAADYILKANISLRDLMVKINELV